MLGLELKDTAGVRWGKNRPWTLPRLGAGRKSFPTPQVRGWNCKAAVDWPRQGCAAIADWLRRGRLLPWVPPGSLEILGEEGGFSGREVGEVVVGPGKLGEAEGWPRQSVRVCDLVTAAWGSLKNSVVIWGSWSCRV